MDELRPTKVEYYLDIADVISSRGTCLRRNYGAVIVKNDVIVSTGYVGAPRGRANCSKLGTCYREEHGIPRGTRYETCLAGNTKIFVYKKGLVPIEELARNYGPNEAIPVFSCDTNDRKYCITEAYNVRVTGHYETLTAVFLNDDTMFIECTPDHLIMLPNGTYLEAQNLQIGMEIMSMKYRDDHHPLIVSGITEVPYDDDVYDLTVPIYQNFAICVGQDKGMNYYTYVHNCRSVHAEQNAIINAGREKCLGATMFLSGRDFKTGEIIEHADCCSMCKRMIINAGIEDVYIRDANPEDPTKIKYRHIQVNDWVENDDSLSDKMGY